jgi:putative flippase GtrA
MIEQFRSRQFIGFLISGGIAALVNFLSRIFYNQWLSFSSAIILAYVTGMITAFVLARTFVFNQTTQSIQRSAMFFVVVNLFAVAQTWIVSMGLSVYLFPSIGVRKFTNEIAHGIGVLLPVFSSYLGHKHFSFK